MGLRDELKGNQVYFDTNIFVYLIEGFAAFEVSLRKIRDSIYHGESRICTSELTLCEVLVPAFRTNDTELLMLYRRFIEDSGAFELIPTTREICIRASLLRAQLGLKTPDSIHVSSAIESGCTAFLTNHNLLKTPRGMKTLHI